MNLDNVTQLELLNLLAPLFEREKDRRPLLALALGTDVPVLRRIEWGGAVEPFILRMSAELARFGEVERGKQALWKLLETVREQVGTDLQARIDALEPMVNRLVGSTSVPALRPAPPSSPLALRVFLASPGDVADERALARQVLEQCPYDPLLSGRVTIQIVAWDQPGAGVPLLATMTPQEAISAGLPKPSECDIVVVIIWARMGRQLPPEYRKPDGSPYLSGTEWEYFDALGGAHRRGKPEILVYRCTEKLLLDADDPQFDDKRKQREQVKAFFAAFDNPDGSIKRGRNDYARPEDFRRQLELHLRSIIQRLLQNRGIPELPALAQAPPVVVQPLWEGSPFPGLRSFTPDDAPIFFGRGRETDELLRRLTDTETRFLAVVGASGSGKSSLVAAGLLPRLWDNAVTGSKDWELPKTIALAQGGQRQWAGLRFTPAELGDNPFVALAAKLAPLVNDDSMTPRKVAQRLEADPRTIVQLTQAVLDARPAWAEVLMFVDQFEELFSMVAQRLRGPFIDLLAAAAQTPRLRTVCTLRADFYHTCLDWPKLAGLLQTASFPLAAPGLGALFEMVTAPAARAGLVFDEGLPARILDDTGTDPGSLALLAFALHELYKAKAGDGRLTQSAYDKFGGVPAAIRERAENTFASLPDGVRTLLGSVFRELVEVDARGVATRRRVPRARLVSSASSQAGDLIDAFVEARLLVSDRNPDGEAVVEVAHDALIRHWERLRAWTEDDPRFLLWRARLHTAYLQWMSNDRHRGDLLRGSLLKETHQWDTRRRDALTQQEREFYDESVKQKNLERALYAVALSLTLAMVAYPLLRMSTAQHTVTALVYILAGPSPSILSRGDEALQWAGMQRQVAEEVSKLGVIDHACVLLRESLSIRQELMERKDDMGRVDRVTLAKDYEVLCEWEMKRGEVAAAYGACESARKAFTDIDGVAAQRMHRTMLSLGEILDQKEKRSRELGVLYQQ